MERTFERKSKLAPLKCDLATFEDFVKEMIEEFSPNSPEDVRLSISISLPGEELRFKSVGELRMQALLPARVANLNLYLCNGIRGLTKPTSHKHK